MTSMERVLAALKGEEADRRAFTMTLSLYGAKLTGCPLSEYFTSPERYVQGQIAVAEQCEPDIIFTPFALALEAQAFGCEIKYLEKSPPNVRKLFMRNPGEIDRLKAPDIGSDEGLRYLQASAKLLSAHFGKTVPLCGVLTAPMDLPAMVMGVENWLEVLLFDRKKAAAVIECISEYFVKCANGLFENGVSFLAMAMMFCNPQVLMRKTVVEVVVPALAAIFAKVKGPIVFHHGGMTIAEHLPLYRDLPNVAGFVIDQRDNFAQVRTLAGENTLLLGNLDGPTLGKMGPVRALEKARKILDDRKADRRFIFATSSADVAWDTPLETITGIRDLMRN